MVIAVLYMPESYISPCHLWPIGKCWGNHSMRRYILVFLGDYSPYLHLKQTHYNFSLKQSAMSTSRHKCCFVESKIVNMCVNKVTPFFAILQIKIEFSLDLKLVEKLAKVVSYTFMHKRSRNFNSAP